MLFYTANYGRNASLAEFDAAQQHATSMVSYITNISIENTIRYYKMKETNKFVIFDLDLFILPSLFTHSLIISRSLWRSG